MARSSHGFPRGRSQRRLTAWALGPGGQTADTITTGAAKFVGSAIQAQVEGLTVIRIRGRLIAHLGLVTAALDGFLGAFGIGIASFAAVTAGIASVPTPLTESDSENWLYWTPIQLIGTQIGTATLNPIGTQMATVGSVNLEVDTKAMRKFPSDLAIYAAMEFTEIGAATAGLEFDSRALVKLP